MVTIDEFSRLVAGVYTAAVGRHQWEPVLRQINRSLGGTVCTLVMADGDVRTNIASTLPAEAAKSYAEYFYRLDHVVATVADGPVGFVRTGTELIAPQKNTEFHSDWIRPNELEDGLFVRLSGPSSTCFVVAAPKQSDSFETPDRMKLMSALVPHLQQALRTHASLDGLARDKADLLDALQVVRHGIMIVGSECRVIHLNSAAEQIVRADDGLHIRSGHVGVTNTAAERHFFRAVEDALMGDGSNTRFGQSFTCERPSGKHHYVVHVLPLHRAGIESMSTGARALVVITDPEHEPQPAVALWRRLYGLTRTESEVAVRLSRGADLKQVADELSVSLPTVRTHLQRIFGKTDTHRQAELVRFLLLLGE